MTNRLRPIFGALTALMLTLGALHAQAGPARQVSALCNAGVASTNLRFAVIGDYGLASQPEANVAAQVKSWSPDLILTAGDNNYPVGAAAAIDANIGQYYHDFICPYSGAFGAGAVTNRFFPALGNHDWGTANAQPYLDYFALPGNERYYDFVRGPVHFFIVDSDDHEPDGIGVSSAQAAWLQAALGASTSQWDIVLMHHAPFSSGSGHGSTIALQWPYQSWGADAVIAGHDHTYERLQVGDIPYFVDGLGGSTRYSFNSALPESQARYSADYGALRVDATPTDITFQFITRTGALIDQYSMQKPLAALATAPLAAPVPGNFYFEQVGGAVSGPTQVTNAGDGSGRLFVVQQSGAIRIIKNGALLPTPFLTIPTSTELKFGGEQGLLALAFHPSYSSNGFFYVAYTAYRGGDSTGSVLTLRRYHVSGNPDVADPNSGLAILHVDHPTYSNHNGGTLAFGPDGYLYWSTGDGGFGGDPNNNAQSLNKLLGKILRLDVDSGTPYVVPPSNPFVETPVDNPNTFGEIWAYGLRNPWRLAFDRLTHDLYIADVGQNLWEEVDFQPAGDPGGENYGWRVMEGTHCYDPSNGCNTSGKVLPVVEYGHNPECSVTGGHVYRGSNFPSLAGYYFYGDYCSGKIWALRYDNTLPGWVTTLVADTAYNITSFGEDEGGELYLADQATGKIFHVGYQDPASFANVTPHPADGTQVCQRAKLGADLRLTDFTRSAGGNADPTKFSLRLDGMNVTPASFLAQTLTFPASEASLRYVPPANLTAGSHLLTFTYAGANGPITAAWDFSAAAITCPTSAQLEAPAETQPLSATQEGVGATDTGQPVPAATEIAPTPAAPGPSWRLRLVR